MNEQPPIKENKMGVMPIHRLLINMSVPMMISMLVQSLYNVVDSIFVAQIGENALSGVSLAFPIQNLMISLAVGSGVGINALVSRRLGEKKNELANQTADNGIFLNVLHYFVFLIFGLFFVPAFFEGQTTDSEIIAYGTDYLEIITIFGFGKYMQITFERLLQSTGRTFYSMISQTTGAVINIILDPILIFGFLGFPAMGTRGAAIATVVGQSLAALIGLYFNLRFNTELKLSLQKFRPSLPIIKGIYAIGVPSIVMMAIGSFLNLAMNNILLTFSTTAVAFFGAYLRLQSFVFMPVFGMNNGMVPIIGYNYGAKKPDRIKGVIKLGIKYAVGVMAIGLVAFQLFPETLLSFFNASSEMLRIGVPALRIISLHYLVAGVSIVLSSIFQAFGFGKYSLLVSISRQLVVLLPAAYLLSLTGELTNIWWAYLIAEGVSLIVCLYFAKRIYQQQIEPLYGKEAYPYQ
ncbi:MATE family efflux transporter [Jeotgalibaca caeni]|uniref:MATE family efflux transporter n=1 Tax=Jeotgalibaca caeni TaxID=3028623 RepID=UPI00237EE247|nr:MATE family efflux transporter [Jeotgalibaca caeni]MDE1549897.1 MATE family efflux transporter [Jeotgalibaca caeni]